MSGETVTASAGSVTNAVIEFVAPKHTIEGMRDLFDVEVLSLTCFRLIPRNNLAKSIMMALLGATPSMAWLSRGPFEGWPELASFDQHTRRSANNEALELRFLHESPVLTDGSHGFLTHTARHLKKEEHAAMRKLLAEMRGEAPKPEAESPTKTKRRSRRGK